MLPPSPRLPLPVHRLDRDTSGCLLLARNPKAHKRFAAAFEAGVVEKTYLAVLEGIPSESQGVIDMALGKTSSAQEGWRIVPDPKGKRAVTHWQILAEAGGRCLVEFKPETGRTHQIRVHMAYAGHGLVGDQTYGGKRRLAPKLYGEEAAELGMGFARQALHAATLGFVHPVTGEMLEFSSPLPADMAELIAALR